MSTEQWLWMMDYCKKNRLPPAQEWAWRKAREAFEIHIRKKRI